ncbi:MAG: hypothetical protein HKO59_07645 [Phycisphaerales bacterium]|nr:hypothetical protein [Phycisphaerales bacterium]NNM25849.1 hypothetical protein [Phycisphaerales bacterium]
MAIISGLAAGNAAASILRRAIVALIICYPVGLLVAGVARRVVEDHLAARRADEPDPEVGLVDEDAAVEADEEPIVV